ncbi:hypothetical protein MMC31_004838, partial [Peltigera leucophlebia]|nr:hypothetical protein [Peltigera leucophlebia]
MEPAAHGNPEMKGQIPTFLIPIDRIYSWVKELALKLVQGFPMRPNLSTHKLVAPISMDEAITFLNRKASQMGRITSLCLQLSELSTQASQTANVNPGRVLSFYPPPTVAILAPSTSYSANTKTIPNTPGKRVSRYTHSHTWAL